MKQDCRKKKEPHPSGQLSLTDTESIFLFAMVHFDLPAVCIGLQKLARGSVHVGRQQIGWIAISFSAPPRYPIRNGRKNQQPQHLFATARAPQDIADLFIAHLAPLASIENTCFLPGNRLILANLFGRKTSGIVEVARSSRSTFA